MSPVLSLLVSSLTLPEIDPKGFTLGDEVTVGAPLTLGDVLGKIDDDGDSDGENERISSTKSFPVELVRS
jgi:hypothetical protein